MIWDLGSATVQGGTSCCVAPLVVKDTLVQTTAITVGFKVRMSAVTGGCGQTYLLGPPFKNFRYIPFGVPVENASHFVSGQEPYSNVCK